MADWAAFATAFMKDTAGYINERKDKAEDYEERQRELSERNTLVMQKRKQTATAVGGIAKRLIDQGVPEEVVRTASASGPTGLTDLDQKWSKAINDYGADFASANPELVSTMVSTNLSAEQLGMGAGEGAMSLDDFISSQYGLSKTTAGDYKAEETGVFKRMMGYGATDRARQRLDEEMSGMGMSVYDINQAAKMSDFESAVPGASVMYGKTPSVFTVDDMDSELLNYQRIQNDLEDNPAYMAAATRLKELEKLKVDNKRMYESDPQLAEENDKDIAAEQATLLKLRMGAFGPIAKQKAAFYFGDSYYDVMGSALARRGIPLDSIMEASPIREGSTVIGEDSTVIGEDSTVIGEDSTVTGDGSTVTGDGSTVTGEGVFSQPDILGGAGFTIGKNAAGNPVLVLETGTEINGKPVPAGTPVPADQTRRLLKRLLVPEGEFDAMREQLGVPPITEDQYKNMTNAEAERRGLRSSAIGRFLQQDVGPGLANDNFQYSLLMKQNADPDTVYRVYIPQIAGKTREFAVKGSDLEFFSDAVLAAARNPVIIRGVAEEGDNLRNVSAKKLERKFGPRPSERTEKEKQGEDTSQRQADGEKTSEKPTPIPVDEDQEKILKEHGGAIMRALKERGLTANSSDIDFEKALTRWSYDNQVEMPFDRGSIIYALKTFIGPGE